VVNADQSTILVQLHGDDINAPVDIRQLVLLEIAFADPEQPGSLGCRDAVFGRPMAVPAASLYLDKDPQVPSASDNVHLSLRAPVIALDYAIAGVLQVTDGY
jgi:hypothetical protein